MGSGLNMGIMQRHKNIKETGEKEWKSMNWN